MARLSVLVVDDEFAVLEVLTLALEAEGHRVRKATDADTAHRVLASERCEVVVCDHEITLLTEVPVIVLPKPIILGALFELVDQVRRRP